MLILQATGITPSPQQEHVNSAPFSSSDYSNLLNIKYLNFSQEHSATEHVPGGRNSTPWPVGVTFVWAVTEKDYVMNTVIESHDL